MLRERLTSDFLVADREVLSELELSFLLKDYFDFDSILPSYRWKLEAWTEYYPTVSFLVWGISMELLDDVLIAELIFLLQFSAAAVVVVVVVSVIGRLLFSSTVVVIVT